MAWYFIVLLTVVVYNLIGVLISVVLSCVSKNFEDSIVLENTFTKIYTYGIFILIVYIINCLVDKKLSNIKGENE